MESITFFGGGNMASAIAGGMQRAHRLPKWMTVVDPDDKVRQAWSEQFGAKVFSRVEETACASQCWVLAVKPQQMKDLCQAIEALRISESHCVISVAAGIRLESLREWLGSQHRLIRCMPNTPALIGRGITGLYADMAVSSDDRRLAQLIVDCVGKSLWLDQETDLDAVTAVSGSGPAYVFRFIEAMQVAAQTLGLSPETARLLVIETLRGASELAAESALTSTQLREQVTSKGGTTAAALEVLDQEDFGGMLQRAIQRAAARSAELSNSRS